MTQNQKDIARINRNRPSAATLRLRGRNRSLYADLIAAKTALGKADAVTGGEENVQMQALVLAALGKVNDALELAYHTPLK